MPNDLLENSVSYFVRTFFPNKKKYTQFLVEK
jgi:hypothetical protein